MCTGQNDNQFGNDRYDSVMEITAWTQEHRSKMDNCSNKPKFEICFGKHGYLIFRTEK